MNLNEKQLTLQYMSESDDFNIMLESVFNSYGFKWWDLCRSFNKLSDDIKSELEPILKNLMFKGKVI